MRIMSVASRAVAVGLAVALALPTGLAAAQDLGGEQSSQASAQADAGASKAADTGWQASDATSFTDFSDKTITEKDNKLTDGVFLAVDGQFVGGKQNGQTDQWVEGMGPGTDGKPVTDAGNNSVVWVGDYVGVDKAMVDKQQTTDEALLTKLAGYVTNVAVGSTGAGNWSKAKSELTGDQFEGLYVYYENQLRTRLAWAGKIGNDTWVVPWDDTKDAAAQCNPADATNTSRNKCFMTKLSSDAVLALSFLTAGARTVTYESAVSAGNAIGTQDTETQLDRNNKDNRAKVLRTQTGVRRNRDLKFSVSLSHPGTYLRVYTKDSNDDKVSACPVAQTKDSPTGDAVNNPQKNEFFGQNKDGEDGLNLVYSDSPAPDAKMDSKGVTVTANANDSLIKNVTLPAALTNSATKHMSICVQEIYWYQDSKTHTVSLTSEGSSSYNDSTNGGMYVNSASVSRTAQTGGNYSGGNQYYPNWSAGPLGSVADNSAWQANLKKWRYNGCTSGSSDCGNDYSWQSSGYGFGTNLAYSENGYTFNSSGVTTSTLTDNNVYDNRYKDGKNVTALKQASTQSGSSVSFLVTDTVRGASNAADQHIYSDIPLSLAVCAKTQQSANDCKGVSADELETVEMPALRSQSSSYFNGKTNDKTTAASAEFDLYTGNGSSGITNTVTLTKGELAGTKVNVTVLPQFFRDSDTKWGGTGTSDILKSSHPVLITLQNVNTDIEMHIPGSTCECNACVWVGLF